MLTLACWKHSTHTQRHTHTRARASDLKDRVESRYAVDFVVACHFPPLVHRGSPVPGCFAPNTCQHSLFSASPLLKVSHLKRRQVWSSFHMGPRLLEQDTLAFLLLFYFIYFSRGCEWCVSMTQRANSRINLGSSPMELPSFISLPLKCHNRTEVFISSERKLCIADVQPIVCFMLVRVFSNYNYV